MSMELRIAEAFVSLNDAAGHVRSPTAQSGAASDLNAPETAAFGYLRER
jgi:hypothetical protein